MSKKWYVVHTYSGSENKVKELLEERINAAGYEDLFGQIFIPTEDVEEVIKGSKTGKHVKKTQKKFFPGYLLVNMEMNNETWHLVRNTPKVSAFIGGKTTPIPVPDSEVDDLLKKIDEGTLRPRLAANFDKGDNVSIVEGPFSNFNGVVEEVKSDKARLKVLVSIFGRQTPIELEYSQVKKIN